MRRLIGVHVELFFERRPGRVYTHEGFATITKFLRDDDAAATILLMKLKATYHTDYHLLLLVHLIHVMTKNHQSKTELAP